MSGSWDQWITPPARRPRLLPILVWPWVGPQVRRGAQLAEGAWRNSTSTVLYSCFSVFLSYIYIFSTTHLWKSCGSLNSRIHWNPWKIPSGHMISSSNSNWRIFPTDFASWSYGIASLELSLILFFLNPMLSWLPSPASSVKHLSDRLLKTLVQWISKYGCLTSSISDT